MRRASLLEHAQRRLDAVVARWWREFQRSFPIIAAALSLVDVDCPLTLSFLLLCACVFVCDSSLSPSGIIMSHNFFAVHPRQAFQVASPLSYWRLFSHCLGHVSWQHLRGNMVSLLLVAPACERHYGSLQLSKIIACTAVACGLAHIALGPADTIQMGASGVVFCMILLNSLVSVRRAS